MLTLQHNSVAFLLVALITACVSLGPSWQAADGKVSPAETEALAAAVTGLAKRTGKDRQRLVIRQATLPVTRKKSMTFPEKAHDLKDRLPEVDDALFEAFQRANRKSYQIDPALWPLPSVKYRLVSEPTITKAFQTGGWAEFRKTFDQASLIMGLSRLGVDKNRERGLLYYTLTAGPEDGSGGFILLQLSGEHWRIIKTVTLWTS